MTNGQVVEVLSHATLLLAQTAGAVREDAAAHPVTSVVFTRIADWVKAGAKAAARCYPGTPDAVAPRAAHEHLRRVIELLYTARALRAHFAHDAAEEAALDACAVEAAELLQLCEAAWRLCADDPPLNNGGDVTLRAGSAMGASLGGDLRIHGIE